MYSERKGNMRCLQDERDDDFIVLEERVAVEEECISKNAVVWVGTHALLCYSRISDSERCGSCVPRSWNPGGMSYTRSHVVTVLGARRPYAN